MTYTFVFYIDERPIAHRYVKVDPFRVDADHARNVILADKIDLAHEWAEKKPGREARVDGPGLGGSQMCCPRLSASVMREFAPKQPIQQEPTEWVDPWAELGISI